jgi:hypothetical protein
MRAVCRRMLPITIISACVLVACGSNGSGAAPAPPPCDDTCKDGIAILALRETAKLAYNLTLQGQPVGDHDETRNCPFGGSVRVFGNATSNAIQGATNVKLTYVWNACSYMIKDSDPKRTYEVKLTGTITQEGILAVQPSASSAINMKSDAMTLEGTVYDPPIDYAATQCPIELGQDGNALSGKVCGRSANSTL